MTGPLYRLAGLCVRRAPYAIALAASDETPAPAPEAAEAVDPDAETKDFEAVAEPDPGEVGDSGAGTDEER